MLKFIPTGADGLPRKRAHSQRACDTCRKRKKRCEHVDDSTPSSTPSQRQLTNHAEGMPLSTVNNVDRSRIAPTSTSTTTASNTSVRSEENTQMSSTAGSMLEESLVESRDAIANHSRQNDPKSSILEAPNDEDGSRYVGHLNPEGIFLAAAGPSTTAGSVEPDTVGVWLSHKLKQHNSRYYSTLPLKQARSSSIYVPDPVISKLFLPHLEDQCLSLLPASNDFEVLCKIYFEEIHPIFPVLDRNGYEKMQDISPNKLLLKQAICLAASSSWSAKKFLHLPSSQEVLNRKDYAQQISLAMQTSLNLGLVKEKLVLLQLYALLSLFTQFSDDRHLSTELSGKAVIYLHTLGLHVQSYVNSHDPEYGIRLFCCIWALDRLNAAFHGRPVLMHERDLGQELESCIKNQDPCFQLFLRMVLLLDKVIDLYRPHRNTSGPGWEDEFPNFEEIVHQVNAFRVKTSLLATIEILYHAVAILSCRSESSHEIPRSSPSYVRQNLSAARVTSMVAEDFYHQLSLLPVVPYAVSLSLRVSYRELRFSKVSMFRARARRQLMANCNILRELGKIFWVALSMADLAEQTLSEIDKVCSSIAQEDAVTQTTAKGLVRDHLSTPESSNDAAKNPQSQQIVTTGQNTGTAAIQTQSPASYDYNSTTTDWTLFDDMPDLDVFDHFDPNFNLDAMDAVLGDTSYPAFPDSVNEFTM